MSTQSSKSSLTDDHYKSMKEKILNRNYPIQRVREILSILENQQMTDLKKLKSKHNLLKIASNNTIKVLFLDSVGKPIDEYLIPIPYAEVVEKNPVEIQTITNPSVEQMYGLEKFFAHDISGFEKFRGKYAIEWSWMLYLEEVLDHACVIQNPNSISFLQKDGPIEYSHIKKGKLLKGLHVKDWFWGELERCQKNEKHFAICIMQIGVKGGYHANAIIVDLKTGILTRFEPHGAGTTSYDFKKLDNAIEKVLQHPKNKIIIKYNKPIDFCPSKGPQAIERMSKKFDKVTRNVFGKIVRAEAGGFCSAWSLMYLNLRLQNPKLKDDVIVKYLDQHPDKLAEQIRKYMAFIVNIVHPRIKKEEQKHMASLKVGDFVFDKGAPFYGVGKVQEIRKNKVKYQVYNPYLNDLLKIYHPKVKKTFKPTLNFISNVKFLTKVTDTVPLIRFQKYPIKIMDTVDYHSIDYEKSLGRTIFVKDETLEKHLKTILSIK